MRMVFEVNNGRQIEVFQLNKDGPIYIFTKGADENTESTESISAGDFITMLNWYRYQKDNGNTNLSFE